MKINSTHLIIVLSNLIINAEKYSRGDVIEAAIHRRGGFLEIRVSDQGPPIPPAEAARITSKGFSCRPIRRKAPMPAGPWLRRPGSLTAKAVALPRTEVSLSTSPLWGRNKAAGWLRIPQRLSIMSGWLELPAQY